MDKSDDSALQSAGWFVLLLVRGLLLWMLIPVGFIVWLLIGGILDVRLGSVLGWLDLNLIAALQRVLVRRRSSDRPSKHLEFASLRSLPFVEHRISPLDPF